MANLVSYMGVANIMKNQLLILLLISTLQSYSQVTLRIGSMVIESSEVKSGDAVYDNSKKYPLYNLIDNNPRTAWVFEPDMGMKSDSVRLLFSFDSLTNISGISLINGYAKSSELYFLNNIIQSFELKFSNGTTEIFICNNTTDMQEFDFKSRRVKWVLLTVKKYLQGSKYNDFCISEIELLDTKNEFYHKRSEFVIHSTIEMYGNDKVYFPSTNKFIDLNHFDKETINGYNYYSISPDYRYILYGGGDDYCGHRIIDVKSQLTFQIPNKFKLSYCVKYWTSDKTLLYCLMDENGYEIIDNLYIYDIDLQEMKKIDSMPENAGIDSIESISINLIVK